MYSNYSLDNLQKQPGVYKCRSVPRLRTVWHCKVHNNECLWREWRSSFLLTSLLLTLMHHVFIHPLPMRYKFLPLFPVSDTFSTARRYACAVLAIIVCLSVRPSVTSRSCTKTAKPRITLTTPYDSSGILVFRCQKYRRNFNDITPNQGTK